MKNAFKRPSGTNTSALIRNFFFYLLAIVIFAGTLYVLITSPA